MITALYGKPDDLSLNMSALITFYIQISVSEPRSLHTLPGQVQIKHWVQYKPEQNDQQQDVSSAHLPSKDPSCCSDFISQTSSAVTECSHIEKAHHRDPPEPITWENIFSAFAFYLAGEGMEACLCYGEAVAMETCVSQTSSIPDYF